MQDGQVQSITRNAEGKYKGIKEIIHGEHTRDGKYKLMQSSLHQRFAKIIYIQAL